MRTPDRSPSADRRPTIAWLAAAALLLALLLAVPAAQAQSTPPKYTVTFLGAGTPIDINNSGLVVGRGVNGSNFTPLVSSGGQPWVALPMLSGAVSAFPTAVNDSGVIVGVSYSATMNAVAVRWTPTGGGYSVAELPRPTGDASSYATGINNLGQIVGARGALGYLPTSTGWLYSDALGMVTLQTAYNWYDRPVGLNDNGRIVAGTSWLNLADGTIHEIPAGPTNYQPIGVTAINNNNRMAGTAPLRSTSLNIVSVFLYDGSAWSQIAGTSRYTTFSSLNNLGDIGYGELGPGLYLHGLGTYPLAGLLDPAAVAAGWTVTGNAVQINDQRVIAAAGRNNTTGQVGGVLLTPDGTLPPPPAPTGLQGVAHPATPAEPYNAIVLSWTSPGTLAQSYEMERRQVGGQWAALSLVPPATATGHVDSTVVAGQTYDYRVRAVGLAGPGAWSAEVRVAAPSQPADTTPPVVQFIKPKNGATVKGVVSVSARATDNFGVVYFQLSYWDPFRGQEIVLGATTAPGVFTTSWDTNSLPAATYVLYAYAYDALGNWTREEISVKAGLPTMRVNDILLTGKAHPQPSKERVSATIGIRDSKNRPVSGAAVTLEWALPSGGTLTQTVVTKGGKAITTVTGSGYGTYTLTVVDVVRAGYHFDAAAGMTVGSITLNP